MLIRIENKIDETLTNFFRESGFKELYNFERDNNPQLPLVYIPNDAIATCFLDKNGSLFNTNVVLLPQPKKVETHLDNLDVPSHFRIEGFDYKRKEYYFDPKSFEAIHLIDKPLGDRPYDCDCGYLFQAQNKAQLLEFFYESIPFNARGLLRTLNN